MKHSIHIFWRLLGFLLLVGNLQAQGAWPMIGGNPGRTSFRTEPGTTLWEVARTLPIEYFGEGGVSVWNNMMFISSTDSVNRLVAVDLTQGEIAWTFDVPNSTGGAAFTPAVSDGVVLIGGQGADRLYGLDVLTGEERWHVTTANLFTRSPIIQFGRAYIGAPARFLCIDVQTGDIIWELPHLIPQVIPAADELRVYVCSRDSLYALDLETGEIHWQREDVPHTNFTQFAVDDLYLYVGLGDLVYALDKEDGTTIWVDTLDTGAFLVDFPGTLAANGEYVLAKTGTMPLDRAHYRLLDRATGQVVNEFDGGLFTWSAPTWLGQMVLDFNQGHFRGFDVLTGEEVISLENLPLSRYCSQIPIANDRIYLTGGGLSVIELKPRALAVKTLEAIEGAVLMPNPAMDVVDVAFTLSAPLAIDLRIYTTAGALLRHTSLGHLQPGEHRVQEDVSTLTPGTYFFALVSEDRQQTLRLQVVR